MAYATLSDRLLHSVVWFSGGAVVLMILVLLHILNLRLSLIARRKHELWFMRTWQPLMARAVAGEMVEPPELARADLALFLKLWNHLHESVRGGARKHLNIFALRTGILQHIGAMLRDKSRGKRLLALTTLGNLGSRDDWPAIRAFCDLPDPLLSWTAVHTLFQIDARAALRELEGQLVERLDWPVAHLVALLREAATDELYDALAKRAARMADSDDPHQRVRLRRLLQILQSAPHQLVMPAINSILGRTRDDETLAQCLKFLREPEELPRVRAHASHLNWVVRLQVAQAFGRFGAAEDVPRLVLLLSDPVWWVRYRAAQAIISLVRDDAQALADLRAQLTDQFALDMLAMAAAEKGHA